METLAPDIRLIKQYNWPAEFAKPESLALEFPLRALNARSTASQELSIKIIRFVDTFHPSARIEEARRSS